MNKFFILLILVFAIALAGVSYAYIKTKGPVVSPGDIQKPIAIDTSDWVKFPTDPSYTWSISHPTNIKPEGVQAEFRISTTNDINYQSGIMFSIEQSSITPDNGTFADQVKRQEKNAFCPVTEHTKPFVIRDYQAYSFLSKCDGYTVRSIEILNPNTTTETLQLKEYIHSTASEYDELLAQQMLESIKFRKPLDTSDNNGLLNTYHDIVNGYSVKFPVNFRTEEDAGWPNATLILYQGGQSYDFVIQVWDSQKEFEDEYGDISGDPRLVVRHKDGKIITLFNVTNTEEGKEIIKSFQED